MLDISPDTLPVDMLASLRIFGGDTKVGITGNEFEVKYIFLIGFIILIGVNSVCSVTYLSVLLPIPLNTVRLEFDLLTRFNQYTVSGKGAPKGGKEFNF